MTRKPAIVSFVFGPLLLATAAWSQSPAPSLPLGAAGRPQTPGITRTTLRDDAKVTVTRVHFSPGAQEPPHTHPNDVILVPVTTGSVKGNIGDKVLTRLAAGEVQFVGRDVPHSVGNGGNETFELIAISLK